MKLKKDKPWWTEPLEINEHRLDFEWRRQQKLYRRYARRAAMARNKVNESKARMELAEAELTLEVTKNPGKFGLETKTIPIVEATVTAHPKYQKAVSRHNKAKYELDLVQSMVDALDSKKRALQDYVSLWLASYFADPSVRVSGRASEEMTKRAVRKPLRD